MTGRRTSTSGNWGVSNPAYYPVPDTECQSTHRHQLRLVISVCDGHGCRLHPLQRLCQTHRPYGEVVVLLA